MKLKHSFATRRNKNGELSCDVKKVAKILLNYGNIPKSLNLTRAYEITLVAQAYLLLYKKYYRLNK